MRNRRAKIVNLAGRRRRPVSLIHFVTNACDARCGHCFIDFDDKASQRARMRLDDVERLASSLGPQAMNVNLTGGEPFLSPDLLPIARAYLDRSSIDSVYITSHGGFPDRIAAFVEELAPQLGDRTLFVSLSIDQLGEAHDAARRVRGLFDRALRSYAWLKAYGGRVVPNVSVTVSEFNCDAVEEIFEGLVGEHGVTSITTNLARDEGVYATPPARKRAILAGYQRLNELVTTRPELTGYAPQTMLGRMMNEKERIMTAYVAQEYERPRYRLPCRAGALLAVVHPNGDVFPCEILDDKPLGNLHDHGFDLLALWGSEQAQAVRRWIRDTRCHCAFECAWSFNILGSRRHQPALLRAALPGGGLLP